MNKGFRKSQAAMEFLLTYGWAILVVLVAIGALAYFGVLSPDRFLPSKCVLSAGIACTDFRIESGTQQITVVLRNGLGFDLNGVTVSVDSCSGSTIPATMTLANGGQQQIVDTTCALVSGSKYNGNFNVTYTNADTGVVHNVQGSITGRAE